jgi:hypothetical protein
MTTQGMEAGTAETGTGSVHDSPVREADAPYYSCLCGARQPNPHPQQCWNCKEDTMGKTYGVSDAE